MIRPIETRYAGCRFRSRLEARWAVFFDNLGIRWEYERQGFELAPLTPAQVKLNEERGIFSAEGDANHLGYYLPDFWLPEQSAWLEIKGADPDDRERARFDRFCELAEQPAFIAVGSIPDPRNIDVSGHSQADGFDIETYHDYHYAWTRCRLCGFFDLTFDARSARTSCGCHGTDCALCNGDKCYNGDAPEIVAAYTAARSARFEHGETP